MGLMAKSRERIEVTCPSCQNTLLVDPKTGLVLHSEGKKSDYSIEEGLEKIKARKEKTGELFEKVFQQEKKRQDSLEDKFREALASKDELDEPLRPWELD